MSHDDDVVEREAREIQTLAAVLSPDAPPLGRRAALEIIRAAATPRYIQSRQNTDTGQIEVWGSEEPDGPFHLPALTHP
jgi:hypothetical protein